ncbi:MAG TPA: 5-oxoprolinase, partial [Gemmatimonadetes bacterium]|nr:5-oxoprolinase [Gemmatimonadota bacterium]
MPLLAVDTGGTFTDLVLLTDGEIQTLKVPSTPNDPSQAVLDGIKQILRERADFVLLHGSTVATNALLERRGARVALVTNEGFEDVIEIGRQDRPQLYALVGHRPPPLVARDDRIGVPGRIGPQGEELEPLNEERLAGLANDILERGAESVAISLLHSYANSAHEQKVSKAIAEGLADYMLPISVSSQIVPEFREYERTSTTVLNAYVAPIMDRYLGRLAREAGAARLSIMGSNGGALTIERAQREPVHTVLSGPAGGVVGALTWGDRAGFDSVLSFDMGGTSTDVSLCPGRPLRTREFSIGGQPAAIPVIDIHTVGAGGGSIARVDLGGALRVGPRSAGAQPGPICYGLGGEEVTVTDAHVWLGRLPADAFLGGTRSLDRNAIQGPLREIAQALDMTLDQAAEGVLAVADTAMERALRVISVERGYDPVDFAVVAFGGAGGLHVAELTRRLGSRRALVPPDPGLLSAYGMLASPVTQEASRTVLLNTETPDLEIRLFAALSDLEESARKSMAEEGVEPSSISVERWVDARYQGQSFELSVPVEGWDEGFHTAHHERYGYKREQTPVEAVTLRIIASAPPHNLRATPLPAMGNAAQMRPVSLIYRGIKHEAMSLWRSELGPKDILHGPLVVQEYSGTVWV